jgi:hypothetical protein
MDENNRITITVCGDGGCGTENFRAIGGWIRFADEEIQANPQLP